MKQNFAFIIVFSVLVLFLFSLNTSCTKTVEKTVTNTVRDTIYINNTVRDTVIVTRTVTDTLVVSVNDTIYQNKLVYDTLILGAESTLAPEAITFLNTNTSTYNQWFNNAIYYYDGWTKTTIQMDAVIVFYGPVSIDPFDTEKGISKMIFASYYQGKLFATQEYDITTLVKVNALRMTTQTGGPGLTIPDYFLTTNTLVDTYGQSAFIVKK